MNTITKSLSINLASSQLNSGPSSQAHRPLSGMAANSLLLLLVAGFLLTNIACSPNPASLANSPDTLVSEEDASIVNGQAVKSTEDISMSTVDLYLTFGSGGASRFTNFCSGTLIAPDLVITAAHCVADLSQELGIDKATYLKNVQVGFGSAIVKSLKDTRVKFVGLKSLQVHPEYAVGSVENAETTPMKDVALLKLARVAPRGFSPALLPTDQQVLKAGDRVTLAGFGLTNGVMGVRAKSLNKVDVTIHNPELTATQFSYVTVGGQTACSGDSGGPAYIRDSQGKLVVVGVTSWGDNQCVEMGAYSSVSKFKNWIAAAKAQL